MNLFLLRHGLAVEREEFDYASDADRPLTPKGRKQLRTIAAALRKMELHFDVILSSPLVRARETAEIIAAELKSRKRLSLADELKPGTDAKRLVHKLAHQKPAAKNILLVGHEPDFSELISLLVAGHVGAGFALKKGGLAHLEIDKLRFGGCALLAWLLTTAQMKLMC
jgi:phosphohistidine phosphatase